MDRFGKIADRWWQGAQLLLAAGAVYLLALLAVMVPLAVLDSLGAYHPTNWTYWGGAAMLAPFGAGSSMVGELFRAILDDSAAPERQPAD